MSRTCKHELELREYKFVCIHDEAAHILRRLEKTAVMGHIRMERKLSPIWCNVADMGHSET
jgi:hypothetical protein